MEQQTVEVEVYEAPAMVEAGDFTEVTHGPTSGGPTASYAYHRY